MHGIKVVGTYEKKIEICYLIHVLPARVSMIYILRPSEFKIATSWKYFAEWCKTSKNLEEVNVHQYFIFQGQLSRRKEVKL